MFYLCEVENVRVMHNRSNNIDSLSKNSFLISQWVEMSRACGDLVTGDATLLRSRRHVSAVQRLKLADCFE